MATLGRFTYWRYAFYVCISSQNVSCFAANQIELNDVWSDSDQAKNRNHKPIKFAQMGSR